MKLHRFISTGLIISLLAACSHDGGQDGGVRKQDVGTVLGAVGGAALGSQFGKGDGRVAMIAAGTLLGAWAGSEFGASLDKADMAYHSRTAQSALETTKSGTTSTWKNPDSGHSGTITPTRTYQVASGDYCREFTQTVNIGGKTEEAYGKACRQPDGAWQIVQ